MKIYFIKYKYVFLNVYYFSLYYKYNFIEYKNTFLLQISNHKYVFKKRFK